jgi:hypothetical protein
VQDERAGLDVVHAVVVAYAADPTSNASVPLIGAHVVEGLSEVSHATVIAHRRDGRALADVVIPRRRLHLAGVCSTRRNLPEGDGEAVPRPVEPHFDTRAP